MRTSSRQTPLVAVLATAAACLTPNVTLLRAQASAPVALTQLAGPVSIDGMPDEPAWQTIPALPLTMYTPGARPSWA